MTENACSPVFTLKYTLRMLLKLNYASHRIRKQTTELLCRINPLAAGMTECERGRCRTKSRLAGWTHILGMVAQNMSQWMADHRRRVASEVGCCSLLTPPPNSTFPPCRAPFLFSCSFTLSSGIRCNCLSVYGLCLSILYIFKQSLVSFNPHLSNPPPLSLTLW